MANSLAPSASLPSFLQSQPWQSSQNQLNQLPGQFNTSALRNSYGQQEAQNWSQGSALAAAAANQYVQRARQSGASPLGAGFAQASAMLPVYQQNAEMNSDLQNKLLQYHTSQAQIGAGLSGDIGRLQSQNQSTLADYFLNQQKLQQSQNQFGQSLGLQYGQLAQQKAFQTGQLKNQAAQLALQYNPIKGGSYATNNQGAVVGNTPYTNSVNYQAGVLGSIGQGYQPFQGIGGPGAPMAGYSAYGPYGGGASLSGI